MYKSDTIDKVVELIVAAAAPEKVVLFGSRARGNNNEQSDVDILILKKHLKNTRKLTGNLYRTFLKENIKIPIDLVALDYGKYDSLKNETGYIYKTIAKEGKVLYEQLH